MKYYVGLDVAMKKTSICIVDEQGKIVHESEAKTDPHALADVIEKAKLQIELVGFESGSLSHFLNQGFKERAMPAICIDARKMSAILSIKVNKTDKNDARGIANALRTGMYSRVYEKPIESVNRSGVLSIRRNHVNQRTDIKNHIRGILKTFGIRLGSVGPTRFSEVVKQRIQNELDAFLYSSIEGQLEIFDALTQKILELDRKLLRLANEDKETRILMTAHGVGPIIALTYKAEIFDPGRFKKSRTVGAYLGMTPTQYSSGEVQKQGRISKYGSNELRALLTEAGVVILTRSQKWSKLKAWGLKIMRKKGLQKAALAVGRKLAVIMHQMLIKQQEFIWGNPPAKAA
jgi:transposase